VDFFAHLGIPEPAPQKNIRISNSQAGMASESTSATPTTTAPEDVMVEMVMTVVVVVLCAEVSTTGGVTVTRLW
jgi:hypothetical protein